MAITLDTTKFLHSVNASPAFIDAVKEDGCNAAKLYVVLSNESIPSEFKKQEADIRQATFDLLPNIQQYIISELLQDDWTEEERLDFLRNDIKRINRVIAAMSKVWDIKNKDLPETKIKKGKEGFIRYDRSHFMTLLREAITMAGNYGVTNYGAYIIHYIDAKL
jgi:hypothetical protein